MESIGRREFCGHLTKTGAVLMFAAAGGAPFIESGCSATTVFTDIENWVPVGLAAVDSVVAILEQNGVPIPPGAMLAVTAAKAAFSALTSAINEYKSTTPPPVGALAQIETAIKDITDQLGTFLAAINIPTNNVFNIVSGLITIALSTIAAFAAQLPAAAVQHLGSRLTTFRLNGQIFRVAPKHRTRRAFKRDWNSELDAGKKAGVGIPTGAYLKLTIGEHLAPSWL